MAGVASADAGRTLIHRRSCVAFRAGNRRRGTNSVAIVPMWMFVKGSVIDPVGEIAWGGVRLDSVFYTERVQATSEET